MLIKAVKTERYQDYTYPCMFIACHSCSFKCEKECKMRVCQNSDLAKSPDIDVPINEMIEKYINNPITKSVVFGGLEPFDDIGNVLEFIRELRRCGVNDDVVIYTGYTKKEVAETFSWCACAAPYCDDRGVYIFLQRFGNDPDILHQCPAPDFA